VTDPSTETWRAAVGQSTSAQLREATRLLEYALHLRMHGERAPGGNETWRQFDQDAEHFLRGMPVRPTPHLEAVKTQLAETQAALAASQQDLTAMQEQRDEARADLEIAERERDGARAAAEEFWRQRDKARAERDALAKELAAARHQNRILTAENEAALRRLNEVAP
jgi:septal ring factor EnvC (AmiA/AmiB activator)